jgi:hypothetical protein
MYLIRKNEFCIINPYAVTKKPVVFHYIFPFIARNPEAFLDYLVKSDKEFRFVVFTNTDELLKPYVPLLKHKLDIRGFIPRHELLVELSKAEISVSSFVHSHLNPYCFQYPI